MKVVRAFSLIVMVAAVLSCQAEVPPGLPGNGTGGGGPGGNPGSGNNLVKVVDNLYQPNATTVHVGDSVQWNWQGNNQHSVTFTQTNGPDSGIQGPGSTYKLVMTESGVFTYYCKVHGAQQMSGTVTVQ